MLEIARNALQSARADYPDLDIPDPEVVDTNQAFYPFRLESVTEHSNDHRRSYYSYIFLQTDRGLVLPLTVEAATGDARHMWPTLNPYDEAGYQIDEEDATYQGRVEKATRLGYGEDVVEEDRTNLRLSVNSSYFLMKGMGLLHRQTLSTSAKSHYEPPVLEAVPTLSLLVKANRQTYQSGVHKTSFNWGNGIEFSEFYDPVLGPLPTEFDSIYGSMDPNLVFVYFFAGLPLAVPESKLLDVQMRFTQLALP